MAILEIKNLTVSFPSGKNSVQTVVENLSLTVEKGEMVGLVGESGSGKTMTALAAAGLLRHRGALVTGEILLNGRDLLRLTPKEMREIQGRDIGMIFQEPMTSLDPAKTVGWQIEETLRLHTSLTKDERRKRAAEVIKQVELPERVYNSYPHQLSGGQRQRAMIAAALISKPALLLADEPTTALDVTVQKQILLLLERECRAMGTAVLFISHDLSIVRMLCSRMIVMENGKAVEEGTSEKIFREPENEYTRELIAAVPDFSRSTDRRLLENAEKAIEISGLNAYYTEKSGKLFQKKRKAHILKDLSLYVRKGEITGLCGESGCGKTTLARCILDLHKDHTGSIIHSTKRPQMVFQDAGSALNPMKTVEWILEEPLKNCTELSAEQRRQCVTEMLYLIKLPEDLRTRYPHQLSGGQRQRVSIAAALMLQPEFLIADEPVSALDVTVQKQILALLDEIAHETGVAILFISHDLRTVYRLCNRVLIMKDGEIIEEGVPEKVYAAPEKEYTRELLESAGYTWR